MYKTVRIIKTYENVRFRTFSYTFLRFHTFQFLGTNSKDFMNRLIKTKLYSIKHIL